MMTRLKQEFFERPTLTVAPELVGKMLVHRVAGCELAGRIVEVEAYLGSDDLASHASRKTSRRARIMFGPPGIVYVYFVYGMHHCLNVVTETDGTAGAILIRAVDPVVGMEDMRRNRGKTIPDRNLTNGPGKLCQAMRIDLSLNGIDACGDRLWLEDRGYNVPRIHTSPRIGVDYAGPWAKKPWRFREGEPRRCGAVIG